MSDGALPTPEATGAPALATSSWKLHLAAAIGAFFLGFSDYVRHGARSTVATLNAALVPSPEISLIAAILLLTPALGLIAAWIFRPSTEREAFALGFAVFSVFALAPEQKPGAPATAVQVSAAPVQTGWVVVSPAHAQEAKTGQTSATVLLHYDGQPPSGAQVFVHNLSSGQSLGAYQVEDSLTLLGKPGDSIELAIEARGYERTAIQVTLDATPRFYDVKLEESGTPLFIQRLTSARRSAALPSNQGVVGAPVQ
jgi:hypothetical protein